MLRLADPEEPPTEELDPDYTDDLGDDLLGATPTHRSYYALQMFRIASASFITAINDRLHGSHCFEPFTLLQPYSFSPCC
jgi:hypothetical protein